MNNYDCLTQTNRDRCEMVGSHYKNFFDIFYMHLNSNHIEDEWKKRTEKYNSILICKPFKINETQRGGINQTYLDI